MRIVALLKPTRVGRHHSPLFAGLRLAMVLIPVAAFALGGARYAYLASGDRAVQKELESFKGPEEELVRLIRQKVVSPKESDRLKARIELLNRVAEVGALCPRRIVERLESALPGPVRLVSLAVRRTEGGLAVSMVGVASGPDVLGATADRLGMLGPPGVRVTSWTGEDGGRLRFVAEGSLEVRR